SWTCEGMMGDGKALQMGTSHELGQNFAKAFGTTYSSDTGEQVNVWQTSWGASTRLIGALIMAHGDDAGLRLPPRLAPTQVVVVLVKEDGDTRTAAQTLVGELKRAGHRVALDDRVDVSFGRRAVEWELKGVPIRLEVGPRDLAAGNVTLVRRDNGTKVPVPLGGAVVSVHAAAEAAQDALLAEATAFRDAHTARVSTVDEAVEAASTGFAVLPWAAVGPEGEVRLGESAVTVRCLQRSDGSLAMSEDEPGVLAVVARAY
ncbi:MAG TPA: His/Gly/Thr/Pro-type tRNA ligase C-terminal domain-containing protein, partial [Acidimicrobiales bacterium]|nr:His/Gly/Thr/Pro-type tRNA ligase C-terminal domain-containing protein [Acidimicrobiales bacterium]